MKFPLSSFGRALGGPTGIGELMDDLGEALVDKSRIRAMLGGGQPAEVPEMTSHFHSLLQAELSTPEQLHRVIGQYDPADGEVTFREAFAVMMNAEFNWGISAENVGVSAGGQSACYHLFNALAGEGQQVLVPLLPDYMGYRDQLVSGASFMGISGIPERQGRRFRYRLDREAIVAAPSSVRVMVLSRPTNPSGNVLSDDDLAFLSDECLRRGIPLIVDHAYGAPFPNAMYVEAKSVWHPHHIHLYSLSKLGLPGTRTSIVVAAPEIITLMKRMTAVTSLANPGLGQALVKPVIQDHSLPILCREIITPFYKKKRDFALSLLDEYLEGKVDYAVHESDGAFFLWLWLPEVDTEKLTQSLKEKGVLVISGHWFFYAHDTPSQHQKECLRLTYSMSEGEVREGLSILAEELIRLV